MDIVRSLGLGTEGLADCGEEFDLYSQMMESTDMV